MSPCEGKGKCKLVIGTALKPRIYMYYELIVSNIVNNVPGLLRLGSVLHYNHICICIYKNHISNHLC